MDQLRVRQIFLEALPLVDPRERSRFVRRRCCGDEEVSRAVFELLEHDRGADAGAFLEPMLPGLPAGDEIEGFELRARLGTGGMGGRVPRRGAR